MGYRWIVKCKRCGADITFQLMEEQHLEANPPKIMMRQVLKCSICRSEVEYERQDLQFR